MRFHLLPGLALVGSLGPVAPAARADVHVRAPFVSVDVGRPGVYVGVFGRPVAIVPRAPAPVIVPTRRTSARDTAVLHSPRPLHDTGEAVPTVAQFTELFRPRAGKYRVMVIHPVTGEPVTVRFRLPAGRPDEVRLNGRELEFDYGDRAVAIRFLRNGRVRVLYD